MRAFWHIVFTLRCKSCVSFLIHCIHSLYACHHVSLQRGFFKGIVSYQLHEEQYEENCSFVICRGLPELSVGLPRGSWPCISPSMSEGSDWDGTSPLSSDFWEGMHHCPKCCGVSTASLMVLKHRKPGKKLNKKGNNGTIFAHHRNMAYQTNSPPYRIVRAGSLWLEMLLQGCVPHG